MGRRQTIFAQFEVKVAFSQGKRERSIRQQEAQSEAKEDLEINMVGMNQAHPQRAPDGTEKTLSSSSSKSSIKGKSGRAIEPREGRQRLTNQPKDDSQDPLPPDRGSVALPLWLNPKNWYKGTADSVALLPIFWMVEYWLLLRSC